MNTLEVLHTARANLSDPAVPFSYGCWNRCTCGHIYGAANAAAEVNAPPFGGPGHETGAYATVAIEVAKALGWSGSPEDTLAAFCVTEGAAATAFISHKTVDIAKDRLVAADMDASSPTREDALKLIGDAITRIEEQDERNRLAVLDRELVPA